MLNEIARWWKERSGPNKLALVALALLFVSQFFNYYNPHNWGTLSIRSDFSTVGHYYFDTQQGGTGWKIHKWAPYALMLLAAFLGTDIAESWTFRRWGYWVSIPLAWMALIPGGISAPGAKMGLIAVGLLLVAAIWNRRQAKAKKIVPPPPPAPPME